MHCERESPSLVLQWLDNKLVLMLSNIHKANDHGVVNRKRMEHGMWNKSKVPQPKVIANYNKLMNGVDRSDQILDTNSVLCKSMTILPPN